MARLTACNWRQGGSGDFAAPGIVTGGTVTVDPNWVHHTGAGAVDVAQAGDVVATLSLPLKATGETKALAAYAFRASYPYGALQEALAFQAGTADFGWLINDCAINTMTVSWKMGDCVRYNFEIVGRSPEDVAAGITAVALSGTKDTVFNEGELTVTLAGASAYCVGFDLSVSNNVTPYGLGDGRSALSKRLPDGLDYGLETVTLSLDLQVSKEQDAAADAPGHAVACVIVHTDGTTSSTFTFANLGYAGEPINLRERDDGIVVCRQVMDCGPGCLALT